MSNPVNIDTQGRFDELVDQARDEATRSLGIVREMDREIKRQIKRQTEGWEVAPSVPAQPSVRNLRIQDKVVLLLLTFKAPGNERSVKDKSIVKTDANLGRLRVGKRLVECDEYKAIAIHDEKARVWVQSMALPSPFKAGTHVIPLDILERVDKGLLTFQEIRQGLIDEYIAVYDQAVADAKANLGELFNPAEYQTVDELRASYRMTWQYVTLAPPSEMEKLNAEIFERERARLQQQWDDSIDTMREALRVGMSELVDDLVGRLGSDKKLKPTKMLERFAEFLDTFDARNITGDADLAQLAAKARGLLAGVDTEALTKSKDLREQVRAGFTEAQATLAQLETVSKRQRQISFEDE